MVTPSPYLPDIMEGVVARVSAAFAARSTDPFQVFFDKGIYSQVSRNVYKNGQNNFPLVWLVMNFVENRGVDFAFYANVVCNVIIAMPTDNTWTQQQRDDLSYKPRLLPIYDVLMEEIGREQWFAFGGPNKIEHRRIIRPYWGGGDVGGSDTTNLFKKNIDAISIAELKLKVKLQNCNTGSYVLNPLANYPTLGTFLYFEDDMELIVDGGGPTDPVALSTSVIIPSLKGKKYNVVQRGVGQLRNEVSIEVQDDPVNGGFALLGGLKFSHLDTYFIKIRPSVISDITGLSGTLTQGVNSVFIGS